MHINKHVKNIFLRLLVLVFFLTLHFVLYMKYCDITQSLKIENWPSTDGMVLQSKVESGLGYKSRVYTAKIEYTYKVDDKEFSSQTITPQGTTSKSHSHAIEMVKKHPVNRHVNVFYDPTFPQTAYLYPDSYLIDAIIALPALVFCLFLYYGIYCDVKKLILKSVPE